MIIILLICAIDILMAAYFIYAWKKWWKVLEYYHIDRSEAVAFGDGNNDLEMLKAVKTRI